MAAMGHAAVLALLEKEQLNLPFLVKFNHP
jgi:hypothetical protein